MDEDEWTDRNFGGNSLVMIEEDNNTSEDSATSLDSDEDDPDDEDSKKPLSAKEARQLQREWLKRIQNGDDDEEISHYDNVKGHRYVIFFSYKQFLFYKHTFLLYDIFGGLDFIFWCIYSNFDFDSHIYFTYYVVAFSRKKDFVSLKMQFIITGSTSMTFFPYCMTTLLLLPTFCHTSIFYFLLIIIFSTNNM